ncbi:MAG: hypothetical protein KIS79_12735 [Burkholderiales bacterium]|nr:hypothetical protein [Burkholderiales bacterium]
MVLEVRNVSPLSSRRSAPGSVAKEAALLILTLRLLMAGDTNDAARLHQRMLAALDALEATLDAGGHMARWRDEDGRYTRLE